MTSVEHLGTEFPVVHWAGLLRDVGMKEKKNTEYFQRPLKGLSVLYPNHLYWTWSCDL